MFDSNGKYNYEVITPELVAGCEEFDQHTLLPFATITPEEVIAPNTRSFQTELVRSSNIGLRTSANALTTFVDAGVTFRRFNSDKLFFVFSRFSI
jgi:hypothetical protein